MRILEAFLADAAHFTQDLRLNCLGGFLEVLTVNSVPIIRPLVTVIVRFEVLASDAGAMHVIDVGLLDPAGNRVPVHAQTPLDCTHMTAGARVAICTRVPNLELTSAGVYFFSLHIDGVEARRLPLLIQIAAGSLPERRLRT